MKIIKKLLVASTVTVILSVLALLVLEIVLQCNDGLYHRKVNYDWMSLHVADPVTGWALRPEAAGVITTDEKSVEIRINSLGLRNREIGEKDDRVQRVLCLGDSFLYDLNFADEQTYVSMTEARLRAAGASVELINSGVIGWGTDQEVLYYENRGRLLEPDIVVLHLYVGNDINDNNDAGFREILGLPPPPKPTFDLVDGELVLRRFPYQGPLRAQFAGAADRALLSVCLGARITHFSRALELVDRGLCQLVRRLGWCRPAQPAKLEYPGRAGLLGTVTDQPLSPPFTRGLEITKALLGRLSEDCARDQVRLGVVIIPVKRQAAAADEEAYQKLTAVNRALIGCLEKLEVPCLDLSPAYRAVHGRWADLYRGIHWNEAGHAVAALAVARWLESRLLAK